ncbi:MAG: carbon monoxide dehydrogenase subunit G, partial [Pseudomonadota bacterium]
GVEDVELPLTPARVLALMALHEAPPPERPSPVTELSLSYADFAVTGEGSVLLPASPQALWAGLTNPESLKGIIPGCRSLQEVAPNTFEGEVELGVGVVKGLFRAEVSLSELDPPRSLRLKGKAEGPLGSSTGEGAVLLAPDGEGTRLTYLYGADLSGKVAAIGARMVQGAGRALIAQFLKKLAEHVAPAQAPNSGLMAWLKRLLRGRS